MRAVSGVNQGVQPDSRDAQFGQEGQSLGHLRRVMLQHRRIGHHVERAFQRVADARDRLPPGAVAAYHGVVDARVVRFKRDLHMIQPGGDQFLHVCWIAEPPAVGIQTGDHSDAFASGWMQIRGNRRRRGVDQGFALSDHADWPGLLLAIQATGAERVYATHGAVGALTRFLRETGLDARMLQTEYGDEEAESAASEMEAL